MGVEPTQEHLLRERTHRGQTIRDVFGDVTKYRRDTPLGKVKCLLLWLWTSSVSWVGSSVLGMLFVRKQTVFCPFLLSFFSFYPI